MLKFVIVAVCVVPIIGLPVAGRADSLLEDFQDFADEIQWDRVLELVNQYYFADSEFTSALDYLQGEEFSTVWRAFFKLPAVRELGDYLTDADVPFYDAVGMVAAFLGQSQPRSEAEYSVTREGVKGFIEELSILLPVDKLYQLYQEKTMNSPPFKMFMDKLREADYGQLRDFYLNVNEVRSFVQVLRSYGIDVDEWEHSIKHFLGWN